MKPEREAGYVPMLLLVCGSAALYAVNLDRPENPDELYHVLAAQGLLASGEPRIADGEYHRGYVFTWIVARFFAMFGDGLAIGRIPSVLATVLLVAVLFTWIRRDVDLRAAWLTAGLYAISPFAVEIAQFCRFYALQTLAFVVGCWALTDVVRGRDGLRRRVPKVMIVILSYSFAALLQPVTYIGLVGIGTWLVLLGAVRLFAAPAESASSRRSKIVAALLACVAVAGVMLLQEDLLAMWAAYRRAEVFNQEYANQFWYYNVWYTMLYPTLWTSTGLLALLAFHRDRILGSMLAVVFGVGFLLHSFAAPKSLRYVAYLQPLLFAIWGVGIAEIVGRVQVLRKAFDLFAEPAAAGLRRALTIVALGSVLVLNPFWVRTAGLLAGVPIGPEVPDADWRKAAPVLAPVLASVDVVVGTEELAPLYYFGRHDIVYNVSKLAELKDTPSRDFERDPRTGLPLVATADALETIMKCFPSGVFLAPEMHWRHPSFVDQRAKGLLENRAERLDLPAGSHIHAYRWQAAASAADPALCAELPRPRGRSAMSRR